MQKVFLATPSYDGSVHIECVKSLIGAISLLESNGIKTQWEAWAGCCYLPVVRNKLVRTFLQGDCTDFIFIDADVQFSPEGVLKLLRHDREIVGGIYPFKQDKEGYPVWNKTDGLGRPAVDPYTGLIEAWGLPTGFMRIQRQVFERFHRHFPDIEIKEYNADGTLRESYLNFFDCEKEGSTWWGEDYNFCRKWTAAGGKLWIEPDINFTHHGFKGFSGNYHNYLRNLPGGGGGKPSDWKF